MEDQEIVALYFARSEAAVEETATKYGKYCYSIAYGILDNHEDSEESVNDTYVDAWNCIPPYHPSVLSTFLGKITRRISIDKWRKRNATKRGGGQMPLILEELQECIADDAYVEKVMDQKLLSSVINDFIKSLPATDRQVFLRRYWYMDSIVVICKEFGFSESKVKSMLYRTREKLRLRLKEEGF